MGFYEQQIDPVPSFVFEQFLACLRFSEEGAEFVVATVKISIRLNATHPERIVWWVIWKYNIILGQVFNYITITYFYLNLIL